MKKYIITTVVCLFILIGLSVSMIKPGYDFYKQAIKNKSYEIRVSELKNRKSYVKLNEVSSEYIFAVIKSEDQRFFKHKGFDYIGMTRAVLSNLTNDGIKQGGSTITQQLAKNLVLDQSKSMKRKIAEIFVANDLENKYSKNEILEFYLNIAYFGHGCYGIKEASIYYYHKEPKYLKGEEVKYLVKTLKNPSRFNPKAMGHVK